MIDAEAITFVDPGGWGEGVGGRSVIDTERINSQLSLSHEKVIASLDPGEGGRRPPETFRA